MCQNEYIGYDSLHRLTSILEKFHARNMFIVTGKHSYESCGAKAFIEQATSCAERCIFSDFRNNPDIEDVERGIALLKEAGRTFDLVIAIGGGSVIDMAKLISVLSVQPESPIRYVNKHAAITVPSLPLVALPTTSGSGSEATHFAVVYVGRVKHSLAHHFILPDVAIVDPTFTMNLPRDVTAVSAVDAFSQAIESYWSIKSTPESQRIAREAIQLLATYMIDNARQPTSHTRYMIAKAAHLAGKAINLTYTTAPHALSYPLTSYFGIPHGHAVGVTLGEVFVYNGQVTKNDVNDPRGTSFVKDIMAELCSLLDCDNVHAAQERIAEYMRLTGLHTRLCELGIHSEQDLDLVVQNINIERLRNNPRAFTQESLRKLLRRIL